MPQPLTLKPVPNPYLVTCVGCEHLKAKTMTHWCSADGREVEVRGPRPRWCPEREVTDGE
jgi:hypothetical protein